MIFSGHLANEVELRTTTSGKSVCQFRLAVQRRVPNAQGVREADFLTIIMWGKTAESAARWLQKGSKIMVEGEARTRSYDAQDGSKRYVTEIIADNIEALGSRDEAQARPMDNGPTPPPERPANASMNDFTEVDDDELPF